MVFNGGEPLVAGATVRVSVCHGSVGVRDSTEMDGDPHIDAERDAEGDGPGYEGLGW